MKPTTRYDICIAQSGVFRLVIDVVGGPDSIAGYTGEMQIRKTKSSEEILGEMDPDWFTVDSVNSQVILEIPDTETELYDWTGSAVYDMYLVGPRRWRILEGKVGLDKTVTKEV
jgi:hypothetical protein